MEPLPPGSANDRPVRTASRPQRSAGRNDAVPDYEAIDSALDGFVSENPARKTSGQPRADEQLIPAAPTLPAAAERPEQRDQPEHAEWPSPAPMMQRWRDAVRDAAERAGSRRLAVIGLCLAGLAVVAIPLLRTSNRSPDPLAALAASSSAGSPASGTATFESNPSGAPVSIAGAVRGTTPLKLALPVGEHVVEIGSGAAKRQLTMAVAADAVASYYVELTPQPAGAPIVTAPGPRPAAGVGDLEVFSDPQGAQVSVDGTVRGVTPLVVSDLSAGDHSLVLAQSGTTTTRTVRITAGSTASIVVSTRPEAAAGWVTIEAPFEMKIFERGALLGTTASNRIMLPAGAHSFDLVSESLEFSTTVPVRVAPGKTVTAAVSVPNGTLSVNALPWAEVLIDGQSVGTTPLGNLTVPIGPREVVWRHPQFGERRQVVTVKEHAPVRIGVDFNQ